MDELGDIVKDGEQWEALEFMKRTSFGKGGGVQELELMKYSSTLTEAFVRAEDVQLTLVEEMTEVAKLIGNIEVKSNGIKTKERAL